MALRRAILVAALAAPGAEAAKATWDGVHGSDPDPTVPMHDDSFNKYPHEKTFGNLKDVKSDEDPTVKDHFARLFPHSVANEEFEDDFVKDDESDQGQWSIAHTYDNTRMEYGEDLATKAAMDKKEKEAAEEVKDFKPVLLKEEKRVDKVSKQLKKLEEAKDEALEKAKKIFDKKKHEAEVGETKDEMTESEKMLRGTEKQVKDDKKEVEKAKKAVKKAEDSVDADLKKKMKEATEKLEKAKKVEKESGEKVEKLEGDLTDAKKHAKEMVEKLEEEEIKFKEAEEILRKFRNGEAGGDSLALQGADGEEAGKATPVSLDEAAPAAQPEKGAFRMWLSAR
eukprot:CAMPEP_0197660986 /NCGR_PEP_ID=MMETSP1338-20131121/51180_1 /TAXON_ID=43686 ORGANISM="Pelagodinium beii, Strain RCC1491" /NCGR_SAMPLE_ID=MMETSP1338 /ASSEMBLY_ACC=CAM_ASM_000754 /LENGTH=338 /DNA_ID=CAMNT_0043238451 /DNA_START=72 /DNA_END=1084 /DNA_ORIENTATION=+